ncbi:MAG: hypothetical protein ACRYFV_03185 [Janthinobacterium lividum]
MAYHKRPATTRSCVHCQESYQAVDRRRLYCSSSCKVQACKAKRRRRLAAKAQLAALPKTATATVTSCTATKASPQTLAWNLQNVAVLGTAAALGNLGVKAGEQVVERFKRPSTPAPTSAQTLELVDPLSWLPVGLLTAAAPRVPLELGDSGQTVVFVQLQYLGHTLYYQPSQRVLLWRAAPGQLAPLGGPEDVAFVAEQTPYEGYSPSLSHPLVGQELKTLG